jgi:hypothetical protein
MPNLRKSAKKIPGLLSVEETNAMLAQELAEGELKEHGSLPTSGEPKAPEVPLLTSVIVEDQVSSSTSTELGLGSDGRVEISILL